MVILLNTWKWSVVVGAAALILTLLKPLLDKRYSAKWRYGAWLAMAVLLLLAPIQWDVLFPQAPAKPPVVIEVPTVEISVSRQEGLAFQRPAAPSAGEFSAGPAAVPLEKVLMALWLSGAALFLLYHLAGTWRFARRARRWSRPAGEEILRAREAVRREMGLKKAPPLRLSSAVDSPMVLGLLRPRLLLPEEDFGLRELAFILRHELTHYRRRDLWYKLVLLLANALHWFNPLVWLLRREAERDLELTCDDAVVAGADGGTRRAYSEALLASLHRQRKRAVLSTHFYGGKAVMKERFRNILGKRGRRRGTAVFAAALAVTVAGGSMFSLKAAASAHAEPPTPAAPAVSGTPSGPSGETDGMGADAPPLLAASDKDPAEDGAPAPSPSSAPAAAPEGGNSGTAAPEPPSDSAPGSPTGIAGDFDYDGIRDTEVEINGQIYPLVWNPDEGWFAPIPGIDGIFSASGDYNGDGRPDTEVQINGQRYRITPAPEGGVIYTPIAPDGEN